MSECVQGPGLESCDYVISGKPSQVSQSLVEEDRSRQVKEDVLSGCRWKDWNGVRWLNMVACRECVVIVGNVVVFRGEVGCKVE